MYIFDILKYMLTFAISADKNIIVYTTVYVIWNKNLNQVFEKFKLII